MKRRRFLSLLGAAVAAPVIPVAAAPAAATTYSRYMYGLAVFHARTHAHVSARGIAHRLRVTPAQAKAMITEMSSAGLVKPVGLTSTNVRATSNILRPDAWGLDQASRQARAERRQLRRQTTEARNTPSQPDLSAMLAHLRHICRVQGIPLSPRCLAA